MVMATVESDSEREVLAMATVEQPRFASYEEAVAQHKWKVPERYNIAQDCCDKHPPDKLAMVWESYAREEREVRWRELQDLSNRFAGILRENGVDRGDRVAMLLPPTP